MVNWMDELWKNRDHFSTPITIDKDSMYGDSLEKVYKKLERSLIEVNAERYYVEVVKKYRIALMCVIDKYYQGYISEAQSIIDKIINKVVKGNFAVSNIKNSISFGLCDESTQEVQFFRARCSNNITDYSQKEMLHIPFSKRSVVKSERFSIPGLPCLYLGTTSYICWMEMGRPADHMFNVSSVTLDNTQRIFNLAVNFRDFINAKEYTDEKRKSIFQLFLLSIATSFKVMDSHRNFKSEYIISQLIMLSCMKKHLSGLTYYSKQVENDIFAYSIGVNLALFAYYSPGKELSDICNHITISDSFNYSVYKQLNASLTYRKVKLRVDHMDKVQIIRSIKRQFPYKETIFYSFDNYLFSYLKQEQKLGKD